MTSAWSNVRAVQAGRLIGVGNECTGTAECIELHVMALDSLHPSGRRLIEVHMAYADAEWLIEQLQAALAQRRAEAAQWA